MARIAPRVGALRRLEELAAEGEPILRAQRMEVDRILATLHSLRLGEHRVEAVNATQNRSAIGHELAKRSRWGTPWGCVYRVHGDRVDASLYSIGDFDVSAVAGKYGGGGHRNAAGFSLPLRVWLDKVV